jgi:hypothetical protein
VERSFVCKTCWANELHPEVEACIRYQSKKIAGLEANLKALAELHQKAIEENTNQIGKIIDILRTEKRSHQWLAKWLWK